MSGCFCVPPPASVRARKVYNILVPDVFPLQPPKLEEAIPLGIRRKIGKLEEYADKNPQKIPKAGAEVVVHLSQARVVVVVLVVDERVSYASWPAQRRSQDAWWLHTPATLVMHPSSSSRL